MNSSENHRRISLLGFIKFVAAVLIAWFHTSIFFASKSEPRFTTGCILVELFFIITGYFTAKHFQNNKMGIQTLSINEKALLAIRYSIKKYIIYTIYLCRRNNIVSNDFSHERQL